MTARSSSSYRASEGLFVADYGWWSNAAEVLRGERMLEMRRWNWEVT